jgi:hypothetical protein
MVMNKTIALNARKVAFLVEQYPKHSLRNIIGLLEFSPIDTNTAMWAAEELGLVVTDKENDKITFLEKKADWDFGQEVKDLEDKMVYAFKRIAKEKAGMEETFLNQWTSGYRAHDVMIAVKHLIYKGVLASYQVHDTEKEGAVNVYTFFTLDANKEKYWGLKTFNVLPVPGIIIPSADKLAEEAAESAGTLDDMPDADYLEDAPIVPKKK